jgi:hypothetical protein
MLLLLLLLLLLFLWKRLKCVRNLSSHERLCKEVVLV